jgi:hypothetical protein
LGWAIGAPYTRVIIRWGSGRFLVRLLVFAIAALLASPEKRVDFFLAGIEEQPDLAAGFAAAADLVDVAVLIPPAAKARDQVEILQIG